MREISLSKKIRLIANAALAKKAKDIILLDLRRLPSICGYFIIASGDSTTQIDTIADNIGRELLARGYRYWHREGTAEALWILLDYGEVVVHIFHKDLRAFYNLEKLWHDAPKKKLHISMPKKKRSPMSKKGTKK